MEAQIKIFSNPQFGEIRTAKDENGEPLFCLADLCRVLGLTNPSLVAQRIDDDYKTKLNLGLPGSAPVFVYEQGFYSTVLRSDSPLAKPAIKWVTSEVLPSIRKTGGYMIATPDDTPEMIMARAILVANDTINKMNAKLREKEKQIELQESTIKQHLPKVRFYDKLMTSDSHFTVTTIGAQFNISAVELNRMLLFAGVIRRTGREYSLTARYQGKDYTWPKSVTYEDKEGKSHSTIELRWKEKGREKIIELISRAIEKGVLIEKKGRYFFNKKWEPETQNTDVQN